MAEEKKTMLKEANELARTIFNSMPYEQRKRLGAPDDRLREINALIEKGDYLSMAHLKKRKKELEDWLIDWYKEICKKSLQVPETSRENGNSFTSLEEAAEEIVIKMHPILKDCAILGDRLTRGQLMALVKAGAEWQKTKMPMPEDTVIFQKGIEEGKRLMMEDAVEGVVCKDHIVTEKPFYFYQSRLIELPDNLKEGDKVKIVIVKED